MKATLLRSAFLVMAGLLLIIVSHQVPQPLQTGLKEIGFALLVSVVIWLLFEHQLSRENESLWDARIERVTKNVFQAVLRKDLPKGLLDEANNLVLNSSMVRRDFTVTYTLLDASFDEGGGVMADCVLVEAVMEFSMHNISTDVVCYKAWLALPNPVHPALKQLVAVRSFAATKGGEPVQFEMETALRDFQNELSSGSDSVIPFKACEIELQPGESCNVSATYVMAKEAEDTELLQTLYPSEGLRVTIFDQAGDGRRVCFARSVHRRSLDDIVEGDLDPRVKIFKISGYLLPQQGVLIWWKKRPMYLQGTSPQTALPGETTGATDPQTQEQTS